jgi:hypothetical protein
MKNSSNPNKNKNRGRHRKFVKKHRGKIPPKQRHGKKRK